MTTAIKLGDDFFLKESCDKPRQCIKKQRHHFANKGPYSQSYGFSSSHVQMWEVDHKESWALKNWCFQIVVLENTLEGPLDCKEIKAVSPKRNQPWRLTVFSMMLKLKLQYFGYLIQRANSLEKTLMLGKIEGEGDDRGWHGCMASLIQWTWTWTNSRRWWGKRRPKVL